MFYEIKDVATPPDKLPTLGQPHRKPRCDSCGKFPATSYRVLVDDEIRDLCGHCHRRLERTQPIRPTDLPGQILFDFMSGEVAPTHTDVP